MKELLNTGVTLYRAFNQSPISQYSIIKPLFNKNQATIFINHTSRKFSATKPNRVIPVSILCCLKPFTKFVAIIAGRGFRKWWAALPEMKRQIFIEHFKINRLRYGLSVTLTSGSCLAFYASHLEDTPITNRRRFMLFKNYQLEEIEKFEKEQKLGALNDKILGADSPYTLQTIRIADRLFKANLNIPEVITVNWKLTVIDADIVNAVAFPNGEVVVFTGLLKFVKNEDELAIILAHEMAHAILQHAAEEISNSRIIDILRFGLSMFLWAFLPTDITALISGFIADRLLKFTLQLPHSRLCETEADQVGIELAARACFDVRYASNFWRRMKEDEEVELPEFLSTHPNSSNRADDLDLILPNALKIRKDCNCHDLPKEINKFIGQLKKHEQKQQQQQQQLKLHQIHQTVNVKS